MEPTETSVPPKSRHLLWIGLAVVLTLLIAAVVVYFIVGNAKQEVATVAPSPSPEVTVATSDEVRQNLEALDATIKQATADQATAKTALKDGTNQVKIGN